jgi:uncharacterized protein (TIGR03083 family)
MFAEDAKAAIAAIERDGERVLAALDGADLEAPVPGCPGWSLEVLVTHLGQVQRFWTAAIRAGGAAPAERGEFSKPADLAGWYQASYSELVDVLRETGFDQPCWTWWGEPATVGAVARHQVQEAAVHRWDAESVSGASAPLEPEVAADGVAEYLTIMLGRDADNLPSAVALVATDTGGSWRAGPGEVGATIRGTASDLVLLLYRRLPANTADIDGDRALAGALLTATAND